MYRLNGPEGSAIEVFKRSQTMKPFEFLMAPRLAAQDSASPSGPYAAAGGRRRDGRSSAVQRDLPGRTS